MCWSAEVSLQSFLIGITAVFVGYQNGLSLPTTFFCLTIVFMQLIEYFVWSNLEKKRANVRYSLLAAGLLWLQPIASILTLPSTWVPSAIGSYLLLSLLGSMGQSEPLEEKYRMFRGENGHLVWNWLKQDRQTTIALVIYFLFLFVPILLRREWLLLLVALTTLGASLFSFYTFNTWGSMWCWLVNYMVVGVSINQVLTKT